MSDTGLTDLQRIIDGARFIVPGEGLKLRLPAEASALMPHSLPPSIVGTSGSSRNAVFHMVFVRSAVMALEEEGAEVWELVVWVVLSLSRADSRGRKSVEQFLSWPEEVRRKWIPLPCRPGPAGGPSETSTPTPVLFGPPLQLGGYVDRTPSWLSTEVVGVTLRETRGFKRFSPAVRLSKEEFKRILHCTGKLEKATNTLANAGPAGPRSDGGDRGGAGGVGPGGAGPSGGGATGTGKLAAGLSWASIVAKAPEESHGGGGSMQQRMINVGGSESDDDDESEDWQQEGSWLSVMGMLAQHHGGWYRQTLMEHYEEERRQKEEIVAHWLGISA